MESGAGYTTGVNEFTDFYQTGGSLPLNRPSYVERAADEALYEALRAGEFCYVLTARQMGKSSLRVRTASRLRGEGCRVVEIDLTAIGRNATVEQWYYGLLAHTGRQLGLEDEMDRFWFQNERLAPLQRFFSALEHCVLAGGSEFRVPGSELGPTLARNPEPGTRNS